MSPSAARSARGEGARRSDRSARSRSRARSARRDQSQSTEASRRRRGAKEKPPNASGTSALGAIRAVAYCAAAASARQRSAHIVKSAAGRGASAPRPHPARERHAARSGCSNTNHGSPCRREASHGARIESHREAGRTSSRGSARRFRGPDSTRLAGSNPRSSSPGPSSSGRGSAVAVLKAPG